MRQLKSLVANLLIFAVWTVWLLLAWAAIQTVWVAIACAAELPAGTAATGETVPGADLMAQVLAWLPATWEGWATLVIAICAVIAVTWPRPKDDAHVVWRGLYALVNALGANFGRAKNADDQAAKLARLARLGKRLGK